MPRRLVGSWNKAYVHMISLRFKSGFGACNVQFLVISSDQRITFSLRYLISTLGSEGQLVVPLYS